jgi:hypothetical protein
MPQLAAHLARCCKHFALKERAWAAQHGHTAVRLSKLCALTGRPTPEAERCLVVEGQIELTPDNASELLAQIAGWVH